MVAHLQKVAGRVLRIVLLVAIAFWGSSTIHGDTLIANGTIFTSILRLLARPELYLGKRVQVIGFYRRGQELRSVFLSSDDARAGNPQNALWVDFSGIERNKLIDSRVKSGWVQVAGTFYYDPAKGAGHMGMWPAELREITFFQRRK